MVCFRNLVSMFVLMTMNPNKATPSNSPYPKAMYDILQNQFLLNKNETEKCETTRDAVAADVIKTLRLCGMHLGVGLRLRQGIVVTHSFRVSNHNTVTSKHGHFDRDNLSTKSK